MKLSLFLCMYVCVFYFPHWLCYIIFCYHTKIDSEKNKVLCFITSVSSVPQSYLTLCNTIYCSIPDVPVHLQLLELAQTHMHRVLFSCLQFFLASEFFPMSQFFTSDSQSIGVSASVQSSPSNEYLGLTSFRIDWFDLLAVQGTLKGLLSIS